MRWSREHSWSTTASVHDETMGKPLHIRGKGKVHIKRSFLEIPCMSLWEMKCWIKWAFGLIQQSLSYLMVCITRFIKLKLLSMLPCQVFALNSCDFRLWSWIQILASSWTKDSLTILYWVTSDNRKPIQTARKDWSTFVDPLLMDFDSSFLLVFEEWGL